MIRRRKKGLEKLILEYEDGTMGSVYTIRLYEVLKD